MNTDHELLRAEVARRRTFAIIAHPDAGKTTLTEKLLLYGGAIHLAGSVKQKLTPLSEAHRALFAPLGLADPGAAPAPWKPAPSAVLPKRSCGGAAWPRALARSRAGRERLGTAK